ncbi:uncharacterized protein LOC111058033 isoform X2 [Nilaparvata lugens]|uniref:uncharacterized protein LOC111058033 isoform X1 n=1 Tax=Nilaparvata lugens TaxID=108931 RepID=UPI00193E3334|nr:uncharacterized protein LOC111058033 isoform X1 [Nilaparvata lugens]XP_039286027.1 uncharacterized protein LOC111058033 isoform X2 [Nilaparvata lugens]
MSTFITLLPILTLLSLLPASGRVTVKRQDTPPASDVINVNHLADPIIEQFSNEIIAEGKEQAKVDDFEEFYRVGLLGAKFTLFEFQCKNGWVRDISSVTRQGDVFLHTGGLPISVDIPFGFKILQFNCDSYLLRVPVVKVSGKLQADVAANAVDLKVSVDFIDEQCRFRVDRLKVVKLEGIQIQVTGFSIFNGMFNKIVSWIARLFKNTIEQRIAEQIKVSLKTIVEQSDLCHEHTLMKITDKKELIPVLAASFGRVTHQIEQNITGTHK